MIKAVYFDMDGVLTDSLIAHLKWARRLAGDMGVKIGVPSPEDFKTRVRELSLKISPMEHFLLALGFEECAGGASEIYEREFCDERVDLFPGIEPMLRDLCDRVPLGVITANTRRAMESALSPVLELFGDDSWSTWCKDDGGVCSGSKAGALVASAAALEIEPQELVYVGDQSSDMRAADEAGCPFVGVTYGWGFERQDRTSDLRLVESVGGLGRALRSLLKPA